MPHWGPRQRQVGTIRGRGTSCEILSRTNGKTFSGAGRSWQNLIALAPAPAFRTCQLCDPAQVTAQMQATGTLRADPHDRRKVQGIGLAGKTLEVRRSEAADARGRSPSPVDMERLFLGAVLDRHRPRVALPPFPKAAPAPPAPTEQRKQVCPAEEVLDVLCLRAKPGNVMKALLQTQQTVSKTPSSDISLAFQLHPDIHR